MDRSHGETKWSALAALLALVAACQAPSDPKSGGGAGADGTAALVATGLDGRPLGLFDDADAEAVALVFVLPDCPISNVYTREYQRLHEDYRARGVRFYLVYADAEITLDEVRRHRKDFHLTVPVLLDHDLALARYAGAHITPEATVFDPAGRLLYRGRIDDLYVDFGKRRETASQLDLRDALDAVLDGREPDPDRTQAVGCFIPWPEETSGS